ncbi:hypothetical protein ASPWEDRAFT_735227 [Aspergillus wentii DTO 134E9]|uniref:Major facilitator superfamily (MFS) profile domain-containing protein n=1 Tax=Aspergillus wentii DTO 134E9 TaxID=1073089 RepID=A0A1L9RUS5_ASPWE|nr:uncharacterized protein ASPWEDRAFT_735227 [Aspergillus wentii DTO 134E9]OJJ38669.1 hypothetical protein ASPWEDRAFT_735227 [Aspergillus wentii DTO 134E9]
MNQSPILEMNQFSLGRKGWTILAVCSVLTLMVALDGTSLSVALPIITKDLNGTAMEAFWSGTSFLICSTVFQPTFGSLSNIFGRKAMILIANFLFLIGAILAAVSQNFTHMLVGRSIQGIGGGGVTAMSEVIVAGLVPLRLRGQYFSVINAMWSLGSVTGPILGGGFADDVTWRWIFYINIPFIAVGVIGLLILMPWDCTLGTWKQKLAQIDFIGTAIFTGGISSFLIPLTWGGVMYPWSSWHTLVPLIVGVATLVVFGFYETYYATNPMIPPAVFENRTLKLCSLGNAVEGLILWCGLYYLPLYYEGVKGYSSILAGVALFPETFTVAPSTILIGILISKTGKYRWGIWSGWAITTLGFGLMCLIQVDTSIPAWVFINIVVGLGLGFLFLPLALGMLAASKPEHMAIICTMTSFSRCLGQGIGVAIGGVVFQNRMSVNITRYPALEHFAGYSQDAVAVVEILKRMPQSQTKTMLQQVYTDSLRIVWAVGCGLAGVMLVLSAFTRSYPLDTDKPPSVAGQSETEMGLREGDKERWRSN